MSVPLYDYLCQSKLEDWKTKLFLCIVCCPIKHFKTGKLYRGHKLEHHLNKPDKYICKKCNCQFRYRHAHYYHRKKNVYPNEVIVFYISYIFIFPFVSVVTLQKWPMKYIKKKIDYKGQSLDFSTVGPVTPPQKCKPLRL